MTLIAAFRAVGVPLLVGDLLVTYNGASVGLRKKIHRLAPNLAIGWTGSEIEARATLDYLHSMIGGTSPVTLGALEKALKERPESYQSASPLILIGWLMEGDTGHCFRWHHEHQYQVFLGEPMYDGTGAPTITRRAVNGSQRESLPESIPENGRTAMRSVSLIT